MQEQDVAGLTGKISSGGHRKPGIRLRKRGGVIDTIARHPDSTPFVLQLANRQRP